MVRTFAFVAIAFACVASVLSAPQEWIPPNTPKWDGHYLIKDYAFRLITMTDRDTTPQLWFKDFRSNIEAPDRYIVYSKNSNFTGYPFVVVKHDASVWNDKPRMIWDRSLTKCLTDGGDNPYNDGWRFIDPNEGCPKWILSDPTDLPYPAPSHRFSKNVHGNWGWKAFGPTQPELRDGYTINHCPIPDSCYGIPVEVSTDREKLD